LSGSSRISEANSLFIGMLPNQRFYPIWLIIIRLLPHVFFTLGFFVFKINVMTFKHHGQAMNWCTPPFFLHQWKYNSSVSLNKYLHSMHFCPLGGIIFLYASHVLHEIKGGSRSKSEHSWKQLLCWLSWLS
jgi:hypothetical protein